MANLFTELCTGWRISCSNNIAVHVMVPSKENACFWKYFKIYISVPNITHNRVITLLSGSAPMFIQSTARFLNNFYNAVDDSNSTINQVNIPVGNPCQYMVETGVIFLVKMFMLAWVGRIFIMSSMKHYAMYVCMYFYFFIVVGIYSITLQYCKLHINKW